MGREASANVNASRVGNKRKNERQGGNTDVKRFRREGRKELRAVDPAVEMRGLSVVEDYTIRLNQAHIEDGKNCNKFYIIQLLQGPSQYYCWRHWGRVGYDGKNMLQPFSSKLEAVKEFSNQFLLRTGNDWADRAKFKPVKNKYHLVETDESWGGDDSPMGKLTIAQIGKGQKVLDKLGHALRGSDRSRLDALSSEFYALIPQKFGMKKPPTINTQQLLQKKVELLKFYLRMGFEELDSAKHVSPISGVMDLQLPASLDEAVRGLCAADVIAECNRLGRELAKKKAGHPKKNMAASLYASIMLYTSNAIYADLNKCLRDKDRAKVKKYFKYLRLLFEATNCLPKLKKKLYRGVSADLSKDAQYAPGKTVTWWGVSSCTAEASVAKEFAMGCGAGSSVFTINSVSGCDIAAISFYDTEKESILCPGTQLKVINRRGSSEGFTEILLQEVGRAVV